MKNKIGFSVLISLIGLILDMSNVMAQQEWDMTPQPPDAAAFATYGTYPVSYYTGSPDISIPLFTIDEGEVSIPLSLSYNSRGMRVADESTWVGLGWNLYPGGSISRMVVGSQFDNHNAEMYSVFLNHWNSGIESEYLQKQSPLPTNNHSPNWGVLTGGDDIRSIEGGLGYGALTDFQTNNSYLFETYAQQGHVFQPDIFTFNFLGYSGKFYFDPETATPVILDKKTNLIIEKDTPDWDPEEDGWKVILPSGVKVFFKDVEMVDKPVGDMQCSDKINVPSITWKISRIELKNGEEINFVYTNTTYETATISDSDIHAFEDEEDYESNRYQPENGSFEVPVLQNNCEYNGRPEPVRYRLKMLNRISSPKYTIEFNIASGQGKPRLESIEVTENCDPSFILGYRFSQAPFVCVDGAWNQWTHRSGVTSNWNTPANFIKYKLTQLEKYTVQNNTTVLLGNPYKFDYIENIGLPSILSYAQDYWGYYNGQHGNKGLIPDESQMYANEGPYPVASLPINPNDDLRERANSNRGPSNDHMIQGMLRKITYPTQGYTVFNFEPHKFYLSDVVDYILKANEIRFNGLHYVKNYNGSPEAISSGAGLRIKEILNYDSDGKFVSRKKFEYTESGMLLEPVHFWRIDPKVTIIPSVNIHEAPPRITQDEIYYYKVWSANSSNHSQSFVIPNSVGYSHVEVVDSDSEFDRPAEVTNGKVVYKFHNYESVYNLQSSRVTVGYLDARNGLPRSVEFFNSSGRLLKKTNYDYRKVYSSLFLAINIKHIHDSGTDAFNIFKIEYTPMYGSWWKENWVEEFQDGVTTRTTNTYATDGNPRLLSQRTTASQNETIESTYLYAQDNPSGIQTSAPILSSMISANMIDIPLKTEKRVNGALTEGIITNFNGNLYPSSTYTLVGTSYQLEQSFQYQAGKITQYLGKDGVPISFLWGCNNTKPIAKGVGVDYSTLNVAFSAVGGNLATLRNHASLSKAMVTTYEYAPLQGITSQIDPAGIITYYNYDDSGRLKLIKDENGHVVQHYQYHYAEGQ